MKTLSKPATKVFKKLVEMMDESNHLKVDNGKSFMPVVIEKLQEVEFENINATVFSVAHYFEQNGDLVPDPDMTFMFLNDLVLPMTIQQQSISYSEAIFVKDGRLVVDKRNYSDLVTFANMWMRNIKHQQSL